MTYTLIEAAGLPDSPLDAATRFHAEHLPRARAALAEGGDVVIVFAPAADPHHAWRLAAIQELAREAAPARVNAVVASAGEGRDATLEYLARAPGVTGQILQVDGNPAQMA